MSLKKPIVGKSREEEQKILDAQAQRIKEDRAYGIKLARKAGIVDKNGHLATYYQSKV